MSGLVVSPCPPGYGISNSEPFNCSPCMPGFTAINSICTPCPAGTYTIDSITCLTCPYGLSSLSASNVCNISISSTPFSLAVAPPLTNITAIAIVTPFRADRGRPLNSSTPFLVNSSACELIPLDSIAYPNYFIQVICNPDGSFNAHLDFENTCSDYYFPLLQLSTSGNVGFSYSRSIFWYSIVCSNAATPKWSGNYSKTCYNCHTNTVTTLECYCLNTKGVSVMTSLEASTCNDNRLEAGNFDGTLVCTDTDEDSISSTGAGLSIALKYGIIIPLSLVIFIFLAVRFWRVKCRPTQNPTAVQNSSRLRNPNPLPRTQSIRPPPASVPVTLLTRPPSFNPDYALIHDHDDNNNDIQMVGAPGGPGIRILKDK